MLFRSRNGTDLIKCHDLICLSNNLDGLLITPFLQAVIQEEEEEEFEMIEHQPDWAIKSNFLPILIVWRYPTNNEINMFFYNEFNTYLSTPVGNFLSNNPYWTRL